jgi:hypothetical protein
MGQDHGAAMRNTALLLAGLLLILSSSSAQIAGRSGAYSRMGFGARGIGMGNAMVALPAGDVNGYYNPAVLPYSNYRNLSASFGILALDRRLNFLSYSQPLQPDAGISLAIINSGVSEIDGRDSDGEPTGPLQTSENQAILSFANRFKGGFSLGINLKLLYYHLYTGVTSVTVGIDAGLLIPINGSLSIGAVVRDINSKYKWDTANLYGQSGNTTTDDFPLLYAAGLAYELPDSIGFVTADVEASNESSFHGRAGLEFFLIPEVTVRGGVDRIDFKEKGNGIRPSAGFTLRTRLEDDTLPVVNPDLLAVNYTYVIEPFASTGIHFISLSVGF